MPSSSRKRRAFRYLTVGVLLTAAAVAAVMLERMPATACAIEGGAGRRALAHSWLRRERWMRALGSRGISCLASSSGAEESDPAAAAPSGKPGADGKMPVASAGAGACGHILVIVENIPMCIDHRVRKQVDDLLRAGYRVSVVTRQDPGNSAYRQRPNLTLLDYPSLPEPSGMAGYLREYGQAFLCGAIRSVATRLRGPIDVVQFCQPPDIYFPLAWLLRWAGAAVLVDQRDLMPELYRTRYAKPRRSVLALAWLERRTQRAADFVISVNDYLRHRVVTAGAHPDRVAVVRNGPVVARVAQARPAAALRSGQRLLCCWAGKIGRQDRVDLLLHAIAYLVHELGRRNCRFAILGDGECLDEMRAMTTRLGLDQWVTFPGWLPESEVFSYLASADVGLDSSLQAEVSPVKAMEYMAFALPIVAFDVAETATLVGGAGVLVPPGDVQRFAGEVESLLDDPARRAALGAVGRRRVITELSWERQGTTYLNVVAQLARCRRTRSLPGGKTAFDPQPSR